MNALTQEQSMENCVWVVTCDYWNGDSSRISVHSVHTTEQSARNLCETLNVKRTSSYSPKYEYESFEVNSY